MAYVRMKILGEEATLEDYKWTAPDPLKGLLDTYLNPHGTSPSDPFPELTVAYIVISKIGGEILEVDPPKYPSNTEGLIF